MSNLGPAEPESIYGDILTTTNNGGGFTSTLKNLQDGLGNNSPISIATNAVNFNRSGDNTFQLDGIELVATAANINAICSATPSFALNNYPVALPVGTSAQRPLDATTGMLWYNTTIGGIEVFIGSEWIPQTTGAPAGANYIIPEHNDALPDAIVLGILGTGILKNQDRTGELSIAVPGVDYYAPNYPTKIIDTGNGVTIANLFIGFGAGSATQELSISGNVAVGSYRCLSSIGLSATTNCAVGNNNQPNNVRSVGNTSVGYNTFPNLTGGTTGFTGFNAAFGSNCGNGFVNGTFCTFIGDSASTDISVGLNQSTAIGAFSRVNTNNSIVLGQAGVTRVGIGTASPNSNALLDLTSTTKTLLLTRLTDGQMNAIASPVRGQFTYNLTDGRFYGYGGDDYWAALAYRDEVADRQITYIINRRPDPPYEAPPAAAVLSDYGTGFIVNEAGTGNITIAVPGVDYYSFNNPTRIIDTKSETFNVFLGLTAGNTIMSGTDNTGMGYDCLQANEDGSGNTAFGSLAGYEWSDNNYCSFFGFNAGSLVDNLSNACAIGANSRIVISDGMVLGNGNNATPFYVGIGTPAPVESLHVVGNIRIATFQDENSELQFMSKNGNAITLRASDTTDNIEFVLPGVDATVPGSPLLSDGAGNLSFSSTSVLYKTGQLTSSQILSMTSPIELLPALSSFPLGIYYSYLIHKFALNTRYGTASYSGGTGIVLVYDAGLGSTENASGVIDGVVLTNPATKGIAATSDAVTADLLAFGNGAVKIKSIGAFTGGNHGLQYHLYYSIIRTPVSISSE